MVVRCVVQSVDHISLLSYILYYRTDSDIVGLSLNYGTQKSIPLVISRLFFPLIVCSSFLRLFT
jgi:hypothetical protein